jgi:hypothetical protein
LSLAESLDLADAFIPKPGQVKFYPAADTLAITDSLSFLSAKTVQVYDDLALADSLNKLTVGNLKMYFTETLNLSETLTTKYNPIQLMLIETLSLSGDAASFYYLSVAVQVLESLALAEQPLQKYWPPLLLPSFTETLDVAEDIKWNRTFLQAIETLDLIESMAPDFSRGVNTLYHFKELTGGTANCLDSIDGGSLIEGDRAICIVGTSTFSMTVYSLDEDYGGAESSPNTIMPDTNAENKRWRKCTIG